MRRLLASLVVGLCLVSMMVLAQLSVAEVETFDFTTDMGDALVSPTGIISELVERYKAKGQTLTEEEAKLIPLNIIATTGMGLLELDFTGLNVSTLNVTTDMADANITLSESGATSGSLTTGMGNIVLQLPASRSLAVIESTTGMGDITIDEAVNQTGADQAVSLNLITDIGNIAVTPMAEAMSTTEVSTTESAADTTNAGQAATQVQTTPNDVTPSNTTEVAPSLTAPNDYIPVMATDFNGEVFTFDFNGSTATVSSAGIIQDLINMNLARDLTIDEAYARTIPVKVIITTDVSDITADLSNLNLQELVITANGDTINITSDQAGLSPVNVTLTTSVSDITADFSKLNVQELIVDANGDTLDITLSEAGRTNLNAEMSVADLVLRAPTSRSIVLVANDATVSDITINEQFRGQGTNPINITSVMNGSTLEVVPTE